METKLPSNERTESSSSFHPIIPKITMEAVIQTDIAAQNNHDWSAFFAIRTEKNAPENKNDWIQMIKVYPQANIIENIISAELVKMKSIPLGLVGPTKEIQDFDELQAYYVAIDYRVREETQYIYNGINYRVYILNKEGEQWKIVQQIRKSYIDNRIILTLEEHLEAT